MSIRKARDQWRNTAVAGSMKRQPLRRERFETVSGIPLEDVYIPDGEHDLSGPGEFPFTRGIHPNMYRGRRWTMRQYAGFGSADETNRRFKYLRENGQTGLSVAFDLPTQSGYDSDAPLAEGEVGKVGVAIDSLEDMETLLADIPLDQVTTSMTINAPASVLLAMYICVAEKQGVPSHRIGGTVQNDVLKEYIARGLYIFPPAPTMRLTTDVFAYCAEHLPRWNSISISGYHIREAGSTAVQEVAFTLANAIAYVQAAVDRGLDVDDFAPRLAFFWNAQMDFLEEIAKYRAARRMWAKVMKERFGARTRESQIMRFHTQTSGASLTAQQPLNNVVRTAIEAMAAVLGGTQSLHTNSYDEALALPTEQAATIALRTQQIIAEETNVASTVDPLGGAYAIEDLTDEIERRAWNYIEQIDRHGGAVKAIEHGFQQAEISRAAYEFQKQVEAGEREIVGLNAYALEETQRPELLRLDPELANRQVARLEALRKRRDSAAVRRSLDALRRAARGADNLMPSILDAARAYATIGEICGALREVFGEYQDRGLGFRV